MVIEQLKPVNDLYKVKKWIEDHGLKRAAVTNSSRTNVELMIFDSVLPFFFMLLLQELNYYKQKLKE